MELDNFTIEPARYFNLSSCTVCEQCVSVLESCETSGNPLMFHSYRRLVRLHFTNLVKLLNVGALGNEPAEWYV